MSLVKEEIVNVSKSIPLNIEKVKSDFPILNQTVYGKPLVYLDNAASTQKPKSVINALVNYYESKNANIHRGVHHLSQVATKAYEDTRKYIKEFINAGSEREIVFTRGATESVNLVAHSYGRKYIKEGDEILISAMEHHSNIVPWQLLCDDIGALLKVIPINNEGELIMEEYEKLLSNKTKLVSIVHISNSLGTINPVKKLIDLAHDKNIPVFLDGAQAIPHYKVDVQELDCDFYTFSGHKVFGPTGIGVLYGKEEFLEKMNPYQGGGDMIKSVSFEKTTYNDLPHKFEAGTPHIAGVVGLGAALKYVENIGYETIEAYENELLAYATGALENIEGLRIIGTANRKASVISFDLDGVHPHDVGQILDAEGVAVRTGHHCTQPVMDHFQVAATSRASFVFYNTKNEVDVLVQGLHKVKEVFK